MNIRVESNAYEAIEPLALHRVIALSRTDRNREQKLVRHHFFALFIITASTVIGFLDLLREVSLFV